MFDKARSHLINSRTSLLNYMTDTDKQPEVTEKKDTELSIGERIQKKRKELDLTVEQLTTAILRHDRGTDSENEKGVSVSSMYLYEKGDRLPRAKEIKLICYALDVSADWLLFGESWNSNQAEDKSLADNLRYLVKQATDNSLIKLFQDKSASRTKKHREIINDIKNNS